MNTEILQSLPNGIIYTFVFITLGGLYLYLKNRQFFPVESSNNGSIKIIERRYISYKTMLTLIDVEGSKFVVLQTPSDIIVKEVKSSLE